MGDSTQYLRTTAFGLEAIRPLPLMWSVKVSKRNQAEETRLALKVAYAGWAMLVDVRGLSPRKEAYI